MPEQTQDEQKLVTVFGVTNRHLAADGKTFEDGELEVKRDAQVHYYKEVVPVQGRAKDYKATGAGDITVIDKATFDAETRDAVDKRGGKLGIFIHGIRNAVGEPGQKAAELSAYSGETFVVEDWASTKEMPPQSRLQDLLNIASQQRADYQSSAQSQEMINGASVDLIEKFGAKNIDLVAHSRGSVNQARLLTHLQSRGGEPIHSATFAHSDVNAADFAHSLPHFYKATEHINVLYNVNDRALRVSAMQKSGQANLRDGCTIINSNCLGNVGGADQFLQNQSAELVGPGYLLSMADVSNDRDSYGHLMTSKKVAEVLTVPNIWATDANELKNGPQYKELDAAHSPVLLSNAQSTRIAEPAQTGEAWKHTRQEQRVLDETQIIRDFISASPEVEKAGGNRSFGG